MYLKTVKVQNFRLLKDSTLSVGNNDLSLLIGRNNSGKTSIISIFEKFLKPNELSKKFNFDDFSLELRSKIIKIETISDKDLKDLNDLSIRLILEIDYTEANSYKNISNLFLNLEDEEYIIKILCECTINRAKLLEKLSTIENGQKERFIKNNLSEYLYENFYIFSDEEEYLDIKKRKYLIPKKRSDITNVINLQIIDAKRDVSSSSDSSKNQTLSKISTQYFNKKQKLKSSDIANITKKLLETDLLLETEYKKIFKDFLNDSKSFLNMGDLNIRSNLESQEILNHHSKLVYGSGHEELPEHLNGLGYMNILFLLLQIKIKKEYFIDSKKDINIFFIEEPEAHTHPQMQSVFIQKVKKILAGLSINLQTFISTHSSHIVKNCDFKDIRYFQKDKNEKNIIIKNFYTELESI